MKTIAPTLYLKCFGAPQIARGQEQVAPPLGGKALALFLYLAVTASKGHPSHKRDVLASRFWSDQSNQQARNNLRYLLPELREALGDYLLITPQTIAFDRSRPYQLDSERFRHTLTTAPDAIPTAALQAALDLYQGEFLVGFRVRNAPVFEEWVTGQQEALHTLAVQGLYQLAERYYSQDDYREGLVTCRRLLALDPWHEAGHRLQMKLLALDGQRSAALSQYQRLQQLLADELAVEPEVETHQLYEAISSGSFPKTTKRLHLPNGTNSVTNQAVQLPPSSHPSSHPSPWPIKHNLPRQLTSFFGREQEIADLYAQLHQDDNRLITLVGEGGIGKTRLALAVAQAILDLRFCILPGQALDLEAAHTENPKFPDGIWFVPLIGLTAGPDLPDQIAVAIAQAMNFSFSESSALTTQLFAYLRNKEALLILDNFEQLGPGADFILALLQKTTRIKLLVTSRSILNLQTEFQWAVAGLPAPDGDKEDNIPVPDLLRYSSIALFVERAQRVQRGFRLDAMNQRAVCHICRLLNGMPLGIELAAAQLHLHTCDEIRQTLAANATALTTHYRDLPLRHRSLAAVLEDSWQLLTTDEQAVLARLSICYGSFTEAAATAIAGATPAILEALCDKSILHRAPPKRYLLHEFVRQFVVEKVKLLEAASVTATAAHHGRYYLDLIREQEHVLLGPTPQAAVTLIHQELVNIEHAWQWAIAQQESTLLAQSCQGLCEFYYCTYLLEKGKQNFTAAVSMMQQPLAAAVTAATTNTLESNLAALLCAQGHLLIVQKEYENGICTAQQAVSLANKQTMVELIARGTYLWGAGLSELGQYNQAEEQLTAALALARTTNRHDLVILALIRLSRLAGYRANYAAAQQYCAEALALSRAKHMLIAESHALTALGTIYQCLGNFEQAKLCCEAALALGEQSGIQANQAERLINVGVICDNLGNYAAAQRYYQAALRLGRETDAAQLEAEVLGNLGISADYVGDYAAALRYSHASLHRWQKLGITGRMPIALVNLGLHTHHLGDHQAAQSYGRQALAISQQFDNRHLQSYAWTILGHAATALEKFAEAEVAYKEAIALARTLSISLMTIEPLAGLVRVALARRDEPTIPRAYLEEILNFLAQNLANGLEEPFRVYLTCYQGLQAFQDARATQILQVAQALLQERAAQIDDAAMRRTFLENVAANRAIAQAVVMV